ncbi:hypothetical protein PAF17_02370 [Paracoccus sp. Z330]|uniref:DUF1468 domain-containing protein n=1 Tax=Paracoccus onchidii TaxID=3017813 RepID=A0ABT4ZAN2_9RHOB|nr:tripartite tricarboxylate transporter TctB family protein [Paracoccus onchidii]MDB6176344.1 hypothetical protein [Paracoccus onchidii]
MDIHDDKTVMRARDFWASLLLILVSVFFIWRTFDIPLLAGTQGGVKGVEWFNSAAIVPLGVFVALLILSVALLARSIREGGAALALDKVGLGWNPAEALRFCTLIVIFLFYIVALVPRVDFIIASGLLITALIYGYHSGRPKRMLLATLAMTVSGLAALILHFPQSEWNAHDDDWIALGVWLALTIWSLWNGRGDPVARVTPVIAIGAPLVLICAMAFAFRQNVPNRSGLLFSKIEYHYYVTLAPMWRQ